MNNIDNKHADNHNAEADYNTTNDYHTATSQHQKLIPQVKRTIAKTRFNDDSTTYSQNNILKKITSI